MGRVIAMVKTRVKKVKKHNLCVGERVRVA